MRQSLNSNPQTARLRLKLDLDLFFFLHPCKFGTTFYEPAAWTTWVYRLDFHREIYKYVE